MNVQEINIKDVKVIENARISIKNLEGLMQDIKQHGLKQAIGVSETKSGDYVLVFGHRRLVACTKLGWKKIPANVLKDMDLSDLLINNSAENIHREEQSPLELGRIINRLISEMGMSASEVSSRMSLPLGRINIALSTYKGIPQKHRNKVAYIGGGNSRNGNIPASIAAKIIATKRQYGLTDAACDKLLNTAKTEELGMAELFVVSQLLEQGLSVTQSIDKSKQFRQQRIDVVVDLEQVDLLMKRYKLDSQSSLFSAIFYGLVPPMKKPDFVKLKEIPEKA